MRESKGKEAAEAIGSLYGQKIAILGFDREGRAVYDFISKAKEFHGAEIWVLDAKKDIAIPKGVRARLGPNYLSRLEEFDLIFRTPGARYYSKEIQKAITDGSEISSGTKLFFDRCPAIT